MSGGIRKSGQLSLPPTDAIVQLNDHERRLFRLEQAISDNTMPPFTAPGGPWDAQVFAPKWYAHYDYSVVRATVTATSGTGRCSFYVDGSQAWVVNLTGGLGVVPLLNADLFEGSVVQAAVDDGGIFSNIVWQLAMFRLS